MPEGKVVRTGNYLAQLSAAAREEDEFLKALKDGGWQWNEAGFWSHPDDPSVQIMPG